MVRMTPKALRFAEMAAAYLQDHEADRGLWHSWRRTWDSGADVPLAGSDGFVEVPRDVAAFLLPAIERMVDRMEHQAETDDDPDLDNDLSFLEIVRSTLTRDLGAGPGFRY